MEAKEAALSLADTYKRRGMKAGMSRFSSASVNCHSRLCGVFLCSSQLAPRGLQDLLDDVAHIIQRKGLG